MAPVRLPNSATAAALRQQLHSRAMRLLARLEYEPEDKQAGLSFSGNRLSMAVGGATRKHGPAVTLAQVFDSNNSSLSRLTTAGGVFAGA